MKVREWPPHRRSCAQLRTCGVDDPIVEIRAARPRPSGRHEPHAIRFGRRVGSPRQRKTVRSSGGASRVATKRSTLIRFQSRRIPHPAPGRGSPHDDKAKQGASAASDRLSRQGLPCNHGRSPPLRSQGAGHQGLHVRVLEKPNPHPQMAMPTKRCRRHAVAGSIASKAIPAGNARPRPPRFCGMAVG